MRILIVEDDKEIAGLLSRLLQKNNYIVDCQPRIDLATEALLGSLFDLVILDRTLPDGDGLTLISEMRRKLSLDDLPPFLVLSALGDTREKVVGLDSGAIDYIVKPYDPEELLARIRIRIRKNERRLSEAIVVGGATYDPKIRKLYVGDDVVSLRRKELVIFDLLARNFNVVVSHRRIEQAIYSYDDEITSNSLFSHISRLRKALKTSRSGLKINVMRHIGYILQDEN